MCEVQSKPHSGSIGSLPAICTHLNQNPSILLIAQAYENKHFHCHAPILDCVGMAAFIIVHIF
jgi:hypothetical protein